MVGRNRHVVHPVSPYHGRHDRLFPDHDPTLFPRAHRLVQCSDLLVLLLGSHGLRNRNLPRALVASDVEIVIGVYRRLCSDLCLYHLGAHL